METFMDIAHALQVFNLFSFNYESNIKFDH